MPVLLLILALISPPASADPGATQARTETRGMATLLGWSVANLGVGGVGALTTEDERWRHFHLANAGWNTVNLGLAVGGLLGAGKARDLAGDELVAHQHRLEKVLLVNAGLDVAYMTAGAWLWDRGIQRGDPRQQGWGQALVLQGGFLLAFDVGLAAAVGSDRRAVQAGLAPGPDGSAMLTVDGRF